MHNKLGRKPDNKIADSLLERSDTPNEPIMSDADFSFSGLHRDVAGLLLSSFQVKQSGKFLFVQLVDTVVQLRRLGDSGPLWNQSAQMLNESAELARKSLRSKTPAKLQAASESHRKSAATYLALGKELARERRELQQRCESLVEALGVQDQVGESEKFLRLLWMRNTGSFKSVGGGDNVRRLADGADSRGEQISDT